MSEPGPIVFFDGVCAFCSSSIDFFMRRDRHGRLKFAPLQGETATATLPDSDRDDLDSMVFLLDGRRYRKSSAVVQILKQIGGLWVLIAGLLWIIPKPLRDLGYSLVARVRYRIFGKKETCRLPTPEERGRVLP